MQAATGVYRIGTAARLVGVEVATLRNWEQRYGLVVAERSLGRQRLYSAQDLGRLFAVKRFMDEGLSAGEAHGLLRRPAGRDEPRDAAHDPARQLQADARRLRSEAADTQARAVAAQAEAARLLERLAGRPLPRHGRAQTPPPGARR